MKVEHRQQLLKAMEKAVCEKSFYEFFVKAWDIAEPAVPLSTNFHHKYLCDILQKEAERIKAAFERCVGVIQYLKAKQKEEKEIKKEGK